MARHPDGEGPDRAPLPDPALSAAERSTHVHEALAQAEDLRRAGRYEEGIALLLDALRHGEAKAQVLFRLGNLYFGRGDLARAEYVYRRATEEDPRHASAHHNLGVVYRRQGKVTQSVKLLRKAQWLEVRYPQRGEFAAPEARRARAWARRAVVIPVVAIGLAVLAWWLVARFT